MKRIIIFVISFLLLGSTTVYANNDYCTQDYESLQFDNALFSMELEYPSDWIYFKRDMTFKERLECPSVYGFTAEEICARLDILNADLELTNRDASLDLFLITKPAKDNTSFVQYSNEKFDQIVKQFYQQHLEEYERAEPFYVPNSSKKYLKLVYSALDYAWIEYITNGSTFENIHIACISYDGEITEEEESIFDSIVESFSWGKREFSIESYKQRRQEFKDYQDSLIPSMRPKDEVEELIKDHAKK